MQSLFENYDLYTNDFVDVGSEQTATLPLVPPAAPTGGIPVHEPQDTFPYSFAATQLFAGQAVDGQHTATPPLVPPATLADDASPHGAQPPFTYQINATPPSQTRPSSGGSSPATFSDSSYSPGEKRLMYPMEFYDATKMERVAEYTTLNGHQSLNDKIANAPVINTRGGQIRGPNKRLSENPTKIEKKAFGKARGEEGRRCDITTQVISIARMAVALLEPEERPGRVNFAVERVFYRLVDMVDQRDHELTSRTYERDHFAREARRCAASWSQLSLQTDAALAQKDDQIRQLQEQLHAQAAMLEDHARAAEEFTRMIEEAQSTEMGSKVLPA